MQRTTNITTVDDLNRTNRGSLAAHMGLQITSVRHGFVEGRIALRPDLAAHTGYLMDGVVLCIASTLCSYGVSTAWPTGAAGFVTVQAGCSFTSALRAGVGVCAARLLHGGHTSQVWDAEFLDESTGRLLASFRCTQIFQYPSG